MLEATRSDRLLLLSPGHLFVIVRTLDYYFAEMIN